MHQENRKLCGDVQAIPGQPISNPPSDELPNTGTLDVKSDGFTGTTQQLKHPSKTFNETLIGTLIRLKQIRSGMRSSFASKQGHSIEFGRGLVRQRRQPPPPLDHFRGPKAGAGGWPLGSPIRPKFDVQDHIQSKYFTKQKHLIESKPLRTLGGFYEHA